MTAQEVLRAVAKLPYEDWVEIQDGITAMMMMSSFSPEEIAEINQALAESEAQFARGACVTSDELRRQLGLS